MTILEYTNFQQFEHQNYFKFLPSEVAFGIVSLGAVSFKFIRFIWHNYIPSLYADIYAQLIWVLPTMLEIVSLILWRINTCVKIKFAWNLLEEQIHLNCFVQTNTKHSELIMSVIVLMWAD